MSQYVIGMSPPEENDPSFYVREVQKRILDGSLDDEEEQFLLNAVRREISRELSYQLREKEIYKVGGLKFRRFGSRFFCQKGNGKIRRGDFVRSVEGFSQQSLGINSFLHSEPTETVGVYVSDKPYLEFRPFVIIDGERDFTVQDLTEGTYYSAERMRAPFLFGATGDDYIPGLEGDKLAIAFQYHLKLIKQGFDPLEVMDRPALNALEQKSEDLGRMIYLFPQVSVPFTLERRLDFYSLQGISLPDGCNVKLRGGMTIDGILGSRIWEKFVKVEVDTGRELDSKLRESVQRSLRLVIGSLGDAVTLFGQDKWSYLYGNLKEELDKIRLEEFDFLREDDQFLSHALIDVANADFKEANARDKVVVPVDGAYGRYELQQRIDQHDWRKKVNVINVQIDVNGGFGLGLLLGALIANSRQYEYDDPGVIDGDDGHSSDGWAEEDSNYSEEESCNESYDDEPSVEGFGRRGRDRW